MENTNSVETLIASGTTFTCENGSTGSFSIGRSGATVTEEDAILFHGEKAPRKIGKVMGEGRKAAITFPKGAYGPVPTGMVSFTILEGRGAEFGPAPKAMPAEARIAQLEAIMKEAGIPVPPRNA